MHFCTLFSIYIGRSANEPPSLNSLKSGTGTILSGHSILAFHTDFNITKYIILFLFSKKNKCVYDDSLWKRCIKIRT